MWCTALVLYSFAEAVLANEGESMSEVCVARDGNCPQSRASSSLLQVTGSTLINGTVDLDSPSQANVTDSTELNCNALCIDNCYGCQWVCLLPCCSKCDWCTKVDPDRRRRSYVPSLRRRRTVTTLRRRRTDTTVYDRRRRTDEPTTTTPAPEVRRRRTEEPDIEEPDPAPNCLEIGDGKPGTPVGAPFPQCYKCGNLEPPQTKQPKEKIPGCYAGVISATEACVQMCKDGGKPGYTLKQGKTCKAIQVQAQSPKGNNQFVDFECGADEVFYACELYTEGVVATSVADYPAKSGEYYWATRACVDGPLSNL